MLNQLLPLLIYFYLFMIVLSLFVNYATQYYHDYHQIYNFKNQTLIVNNIVPIKKGK